MTDLILKKGTAALGTRLRRLSERLDREVREIYAAQGVEFEASWFPVITALNENGALSIGELATMTGVSQPAISQIRKKLEALNYVEARASDADLRRHELTLTPRGRRLIEELTPIWAAIAEASADLCGVAAPHLLNELEAIERQLDASPMPARFAEKFAPGFQPKSKPNRRK
jgi:MarR family transcriptional regulator, organic hydroperoxide resistance regulator